MYDLGKQKSINLYIVGFLVLEFLAVFAVFATELVSPTLIQQNWGTIRMCGYCKAAITFIKYLPQVYLNWKRQSTVGWSLENVLLDFCGGSFSMAQLIIGAVALGEPVFGDKDKDTGFNVVKFLLSILSIIFDLIFMFQHYVLYRAAWKHDDLIDDRLDKLSMVSEKMQGMYGEDGFLGNDGDKPAMEEV
jgi:cystinosin